MTSSFLCIMYSWFINANAEAQVGVVFGCVTSILIIWNAIVIQIQGRTMRKTLAFMQSDARSRDGMIQKELRAYLSLSVIAPKENTDGVCEVEVGEQSISMHIAITNNGNTPAKNIRWYSKTENIGSNYPTDEMVMRSDGPAWDRNPQPIPDIAPKSFIRDFHDGIIFEEERDQIPFHKMFGLILYDDVFGGKDWRTEYCFWITGKGEDGKYWAVRSYPDGYNRAT